MVIVVALVAGVGALFPDAEAQEPTVIVFNGENNRLNAYDVKDGFKKQTVIPSAADDPQRGKDINAQICFFPDGSRRFIAGEDTSQGTDTGQPGWGIFQLHGNKIGEFSASQIGKLLTTFQTSDSDAERQPYESNPENYGCGFLSDGRVVTSDVGNQYPFTPNNGQLIIWFPPFDRYDVPYCKLDIEIPTAGGIYVDEQDRVYVASNRPSGPVPDRLGGIYRYTGPFPTSPAECTDEDPTGAPMKQVEGEQFIAALPGVELATPSAIVKAPGGGFFVSSVFDGKIGKYDDEGNLVEMILAPGPGELPPYDHGTPFGIGTDSAGNLYYASLGVVLAVPAPGAGTVGRIAFVDGEAQEPETMDEGLDFPDGIGVLEIAPSSAGTAQVLGAQATQPAAQQPPTGPPTGDGGGLPATGGAAFPVAAAAALMAACLMSRARRKWSMPMLTSTRTSSPGRVSGSSTPVG